MTDAAYAYPAGGHPAGAPSRPETRPLHLVPPVADDSEMPTSGNPEAPTPETISAGHRGSTDAEQAQTSDLGFRVRLAGLWAASRTYWTPPAVFTDRPASLDELRQYATQAPWTAQQTGLIRAIGVGYYRLIGYPTTVWCRYTEWFAQRPGRLLPLLGTIKIASMTGPGQWAEHLLTPVAHLAGRILL